MLHPEALLQALSLVFSIKTLLWLTIGVTIGVGVGAIPGLTASTGVALMLPVTFQMSTAPALGLLIGLYKGAVFGGSISAISFGTPGTPEAAATVYDGYKLMQRGKGRKAILMALYASVTADLLSDLLVIVVAPPLALIALEFGPSERFWLVILAVSLIGALSGQHFAKGMFSAALGFFIGTIGSDPVGAVSRNTFGLWWLQGGIRLIPLVIGIFAMGQMLEEAVVMLRENPKLHSFARPIKSIFARGGEGLCFKDYLSTWKEMMIGFGVGSFVGMLPGLGATVGAFLSYGVAKQASPKKKIGSGVIEGVAAAESGNNATVGPTLIPLLAFGIPGSTSAALIGGALMLQGATPSPRMFELYPSVVYALFIILVIGNIFNLGIGRIFAFLYARLGQLPHTLLVPLIITTALIGSYSYQGDPYDVVIMLFFGLLGFGMRLVKIPEAPLIITFLIGPMAEASLRRALLIGHGQWFIALFASPLAIGLCVSAVVLTVVSVRLQLSERFTRVGETESDSAKPR